MTSGSAPQLPADAGVLAIDHVGIATGDLEATIDFYRTTFGMVEVHREVNGEHQVVEVMLAPAPEFDATEADATGADATGADATEPAARPAQIQLLAPLSEDSAIARFLDRSGPGLQQLAFRVADIDAACDRIRRQGLRLLYPAARPGSGGSKINFVHPKDAGGVLIELVEPPGVNSRIAVGER